MGRKGIICFSRVGFKKIETGRKSLVRCKHFNVKSSDTFSHAAGTA